MRFNATRESGRGAWVQCEMRARIADDRSDSDTGGHRPGEVGAHVESRNRPLLAYRDRIVETQRRESGQDGELDALQQVLSRVEDRWPGRQRHTGFLAEAQRIQAV